MWVICCGMRRAASTLQYHIVQELMPDAFHLGWVTWQLFNNLDMYSNRDKVLKCHAYLPSYSNKARWLMENDDVKVIHIIRDIRDVAASLKGMHPTFFGEEITPDRMRLDISATIAESDAWRGVDGVYVSRYEDVVDDMETEIAGIAGALGVTIYDANEIATKLAISEQEKRLPQDKWDAPTMLWPGHIQGGIVGRWRDELTPAELGVVMEVGEDWLIRNG